MPNPRQREILNNIFTYHPPFANQQQRYQQLRDKARELAEMFADYVPESHEMDQALDHLRMSVMWANSGIACNERQAQATNMEGTERPRETMGLTNAGSNPRNYEPGREPPR